MNTDRAYYASLARFVRATRVASCLLFRNRWLPPSGICNAPVSRGAELGPGALWVQVYSREEHGKPTVFVRTGGCDYRCSWCDTKFAVLPEYRETWEKMTAEEVFSAVLGLSQNRPILVTLSGGNPALQPFGSLISLGKELGYGFAIETQGTVARDWFSELDHLTVSPKPQSSGMETDWDKLARCLGAGGGATRTTLKVVIFDEADYAYALEVGQRFPAVPIYLQVGNDRPPGPESDDVTVPDDRALLRRYAWLADKVLADGWNEATVLPQLHVLVWGNGRGV
jgi:7-carboxy-7-deazaguanine synthase